MMTFELPSAQGLSKQSKNREIAFSIVHSQVYGATLNKNNELSGKALLQV